LLEKDGEGQGVQSRLFEVLRPRRSGCRFCGWCGWCGGCFSQIEMRYAPPHNGT